MNRILRNVFIALLIGVFFTNSFQPQRVVAQSPQLMLRMVKDINPGSNPSEPNNFIEYKGKFFFFANHIDYGRELWVSDLTNQGTQMVKDVVPGPAYSYPTFLMVFKDKLYFLSSNIIWYTDGTSSGTHELKTFNSDVLITQMVASDTHLFIRTTRTDTETGTKYYSLFSSYGEGSDTLLIHEVVGSGCQEGIGRLTIIGNMAYYSSCDRLFGNEPWRSDGHPGSTYRLGDIIDGGDNTWPAQFFTELNGSVYFTAGDARLYRTNTYGMIVPVLIVDEWVDSLIAYQGSLYYTTFDRNTSTGYLYKSDGKPGPGSLVKQLSGSGPFLLSDGGNFIFINNFSGGVETWDFWRSDGTEQGTFLLKTFSTNSWIDFSLKDPSTNVPYFIIGTYVPPSKSTFDIWTTDGTIDGTGPLFEMPYGELIGTGKSLIIRDGVLVFAGVDTEHGSELWTFAQVFSTYLPLLIN